ncbi:MAG: hypothetical protein DME40_02425 [Verrucomicrobia bacterium]|nr:MAG: hypothetical protein DME40_02425 [Verrucomicrobiota bacterium]
MRAAFLTVLLAVFSANAQVKDPWTQPHGLVPDKETAIKIATISQWDARVIEIGNEERCTAIRLTRLDEKAKRA